MPSPEFEAAAKRVQTLSSKPSDQDLLALYGLYKQATVGDNTTDKPGMMDFKGKYKWQAWMDKLGTSQAEAEAEYIQLVDKLCN